MESNNFGKAFLVFLVGLDLCLAANIVQIMDGKSVNLDKIFPYSFQFSYLLTNNPEVSAFIKSELTIFAPSDDAMSKYKGKTDSQFLLNHMANVVVKIGETNNFTPQITLSSMAPGSPPLYIIRQGVDYYVNGAKIIMRNLQATSSTADKGAKKQRLHIIDRVLEPLASKGSAEEGDSTALVGLSAGKLLRQADHYVLGNETINLFAGQVKTLNKLELFDQPGQNTFFIPVDRAFKHLSVKLVDNEIIPGHVVPGRLLFTKPLTIGEQKTATFNSASSAGIQVTAVIQTVGNVPQVRSVTAKGSLKNSRGENVVAEIVRGNIPVSNGIIHLIDKPLVVVASPLWEHLQTETRLSRFAEHLRRHGGALERLIRNCSDCTVFAPSNEAFGAVVEELLKDERSPAAARVLGLHFVDKRIAGDDVRVHKPQNGHSMYDAEVPYPKGLRNKLWLYYKQGNETLMVDGLGSSAEVVEADIGSTNGVIHVIDKVLGVPAQTVFTKLATDPMISSAFSLGTQDHFNEELKDESERFTFLVPSNEAWEEIRQKYASAHKQLFMGDFGYQSKSLLERHIRIGEALPAADLVRRTVEKGGVQMLRGMPLRFTSETDEDGLNATYVLWEDLKTRIIRPDLNCTNGYVHVLDQVIMKRRDVTLSSGAQDVVVNVGPILTVALAAAIAAVVQRATI